MTVLLLLALLEESPIPLSPGTWWEYREYYTEHLGAIDSTTEDKTRFSIHGSPSRPFVHQRGGADPGSAPVEQGVGWIRLGPWTGDEPLPVPLETGRSGPASEGGGAWLVEGPETVSVPAGSFETLRCALRTRRVESVLWIAPGVGVVRETQGTPGRRPEIERILLRWSGAHAPAP